MADLFFGLICKADKNTWHKDSPGAKEVTLFTRKPSCVSKYGAREIRKTRYMYVKFGPLLLYPEAVTGIFPETRQNSFWSNPLKTGS